jgi:hypothetical protein
MPLTGRTGFVRASRLTHLLPWSRGNGFELNMMLRSSYSQATAYIKLFDVFDFDRQKICNHLVINNCTLLSRFRFAAKVVRLQPSLFDRVDHIPENFNALPGKNFTNQL